ncbi:BTB/POZ domain-containing protein At1g63850 [Amborella trichopoda]|nr:BTB/POZ domain-containing protein At1g63850 [Amborella trichopoda]|eukprot:XP_006829095.2 BTB/POZ domain-containing protein At1g63850 [Amborella trichopoda]
MDSSTLSLSTFPSNYNKFTTALNAGLLNPLSPPPPMEKTRSSPTLSEMMRTEQDSRPRYHIPVMKQPVSGQGDSHCLFQEQVAEILGSCSPGNLFNDLGSSDVKLTLSSRDGFSVTLNLHRQILVANSRFFASKLSERWSKQQRSLPHLVEISDCDDVGVYMETLRLMYCKDLKRKLMKEDVSKVLGILKVSAAIVFDAGVVSCLEYLEAAPWTEDEEEKVAFLLTHLQLESMGASEVLKRLSVEVLAMDDGDEGSEEILVKLLQVVLEGRDEKARREMKALVSKMLRENAAHNNLTDLSKESLYSACHHCLALLLQNFLVATAEGFMEWAQDERSITVSQISRHADNLHWLLDILIDRQMAEDFAKMWANQADLAKLHPKVPTMYRYEVSRLTARLCVAIGKGQILTPKDVRCSLLGTWLEPLYEDFGWMRRACKALDRNVVEYGLGQTILTLPLEQQQAILLGWFDRFLNAGDDCPNIQRAFEVWWRRAFLRKGSESERPQLQIVAASQK